jgi:hypothetical protein
MAEWLATCYHVGILLGSFFDTEDGGNLFLRNVGWLSSQTHIPTDSKSISKSWCPTPSGAHDQIFVTLWQLRLSDERMGLSFVYAAGPRQHSLYRVQLPRDSWPYFTVSDSRLRFSSSPTTCRATVEVFDPAWRHGLISQKRVLFIATAVRTCNPTHNWIVCVLVCSACSWDSMARFLLWIRLFYGDRTPEFLPICLTNCWLTCSQSKSKCNVPIELQESRL